MDAGVGCVGVTGGGVGSGGAVRDVQGSEGGGVGGVCEDAGGGWGLVKTR